MRILIFGLAFRCIVGISQDPNIALGFRGIVGISQDPNIGCRGI